MKHIFFESGLGVCLLGLSACQSITPPPAFHYQETQTRTFKLASWQKITDPTQSYKIYIEGDGYAFNRHGRPSQNPTPKGDLMRQIAFNDPSPNVIYLARPCQYVRDDFCTSRHWTTARFAPEVINAMHEEIQTLAPDKELILIGYSGGAQVAGLLAAIKPDLTVKQVITVAGNLNHTEWTREKGLMPLSESLDLESYRAVYAQLPQTHYVGEKDRVIFPHLTRDFVQNPATVQVVPDATHWDGFESIYPLIWNAH